MGHDPQLNEALFMNIMNGKYLKNIHTQIHTLVVVSNSISCLGLFVVFFHTLKIEH